MEIKVIRKIKLNDCQIGQLLIDDKFFCYTLEDVSRDIKVYGETAIPKGIYKVIVDYSDHFKKELPHILNVPGFAGIRMHGGNSASDTLGCILLGKDMWPTLHKIGNCAEVVEGLTTAIKAAGEATLTIADDPTE